jgi:hypothetical protein
LVHLAVGFNLNELKNFVTAVEQILAAYCSEIGALNPTQKLPLSKKTGGISGNFATLQEQGTPNQ